MVEKIINCEFFIEKMFSYVDEKMKLKTIKYNKKLQNILNIKLIHYKFFSGKYIIFDNDGKGKEYNGNDDQLIYEGEYLNGKRNGKGKEYNEDGDLIFEGEYRNGQRWNGKRKEYYFKDILKFEGEYLNGERNGKGKEYWEGGANTFKYEGEYLNGERNGKGKEYKNDKLKFEGEYLNGKKWNGKGYYSYKNEIYKLKNGKGFVKEKYDGIRYEGEYLYGQRNGIGKEYDNFGNIYFEGEYLNGKKWNGKQYFPESNETNELKNGKGFLKEYVGFNKLIFEGEYLNGERNEYDEYGIIFEGEYLNGKRNGKGKIYNPVNGKLIFEGEYLNGERNGKGKVYFDGKLIFEGEYKDGKEWNGILRLYTKIESNELKVVEISKGRKNGLRKLYKDYPNYAISEVEFLYNCKLKGKEYINEKLEYEGEYLFGKKWNGKGYDENKNIIYELKNGNGIMLIVI